ncbi:transcriptional repressor [Flavobacterium jejuense]|uniref:Transcriptional repressor n=1 Tax=Flavobacterium jejuense TaxID=1544455 RepID=A0ABX0IQD6_9FLAO|nr:transcriptional repressor [Flavobacterium jejuense]NHN25411.1 transcriptional repressor [Flavobacterium jejuense]
MNRRKTKSKRDVLEALKSKGSAMSHEMLEAVVEDYNRATIYRILNRFREEGIVHRIVGVNGKQYFAICTNCEKENHNHNHIHFQCNTCEKVECLNEELQINLPKGYVLEGFNGLVSGLCSNCS